MSFIKENKGKIGIAAIVIAVLAAAFFMGEAVKEPSALPAPERMAEEAAGITADAPQMPEDGANGIKGDAETPEKITENAESEPEKAAEPAEKSEKAAENAENAATDTEKSAETAESAEKSADNANTAAEITNKASEVKTEIPAKKPEEKPQEKPQEHEKPVKAPQEELPQSPQEEAEEKELYCTLSVSCETLLGDGSRLSAEKRGILPENGIIFPVKRVEFSEGESVFDVLLRETRNNKIHMEFMNTPIYGGVYIEGIGNIYEFDAGELSGWMYRVNGEFPNYSCSKYSLKQGDKIEFVYTCDLGKDVGNIYSKGQVGGNE